MKLSNLAKLVRGGGVSVRLDNDCIIWWVGDDDPVCEDYNPEELLTALLKECGNDVDRV